MCLRLSHVIVLFLAVYEHGILARDEDFFLHLCAIKYVIFLSFFVSFSLFLYPTFSQDKIYFNIYF